MKYKGKGDEKSPKKPSNPKPKSTMALNADLIKTVFGRNSTGKKK